MNTHTNQKQQFQIPNLNTYMKQKRQYQFQIPTLNTYMKRKRQYPYLIPVLNIYMKPKVKKVILLNPCLKGVILILNNLYLKPNLMILQNIVKQNRQKPIQKLNIVKAIQMIILNQLNLILPTIKKTIRLLYYATIQLMKSIIFSRKKQK